MPPALEADDILDELSSAFPAHPLDAPDLSKPESAAWRSYLDVSAFEEGIEGRSWSELSPGFLEQHHDAIPFLPSATLRALLPAWLSHLLRADEIEMLPYTLLPVLAALEPALSEPSPPRPDELTPLQRAAVLRALRTLRRRPLYASHSDELDRAVLRFATASDARH